MLKGGWLAACGVAALAVPSIWMGNLTHTSVSLRFFDGAQNIAIRSGPNCPSGTGLSSVQNGPPSAFVLNGSSFVFSSGAARWLVQLWDLTPGCPLTISGDVSASVRTLYLPDDDGRDAVFAFGSCDRFDTKGKNMLVYQEIAKLQPNVFVHLGDMHYRDIKQNDPAVFLRAYDEVLGMPARQALLSSVAMDYVYNDHDYGVNDANEFNPTKNAAGAAYRSMAPHYALENSTGPIYHAFTVHRVRVVVMDVNYDWIPGTQIISEQQLQWVLDEVRNASDYRLLILVSGDQFGGPSVGVWGNRQRDAILAAAKGQTNIVVVSGDSHVLAYDDGRNHANIPQLASGPLANVGSSKGAKYSGPGGDSPNCMAYSYVPNQQFGSIQVRTIGNQTLVIFRGYRVMPDGSLWRVIDVVRTLPFAPVLSPFTNWDDAAGTCSLGIMPPADKAAWVMCSMTIWFLLLVGVHLLRDGRAVLHNRSLSSYMRYSIPFWTLQFILAIVGTLLIGLLITNFIDPSINAFSTRSGLGYSILFMTLLLVSIIGVMLLLQRIGRCQCGKCLYFTEPQFPKTLVDDTT